MPNSTRTHARGSCDALSHLVTPDVVTAPLLVTSLVTGFVVLQGKQVSA